MSERTLDATESCQTCVGASLADGAETNDCWILTGSLLSPSLEYALKVNEHLSLYEKDDLLFRFAFDPLFEADDLLVHKSRMEWADGPLKALASTAFKEGRSNTVKLSDEDHPIAYSVLRDFLYTKTVDLSIISTLDRAMYTLKCAHRWGIQPLAHHIASYIEENDMFQEVADFVQYVDSAVLHESLQFYFWQKVGEMFDAFAEVDQVVEKEVKSNEILSVLNGSDCEQRVSPKDDASIHEDGSQPDVEVSLCPRFPRLWPCAVDQNMFHVVMGSVLLNSVCDRRKLVDIVLRYFEPRESSDDIVTRMIRMVVGTEAKTMEYVLNQCSVDVKCSTRAMRLFAKSIVTPIRDISRFVWETSLHEIDKMSFGERRFTPVCVSLSEDTFGGVQFFLNWDIARYNRRKGYAINLRWEKGPDSAPCVIAVRLMAFDDLCFCPHYANAMNKSRAWCLGKASSRRSKPSDIVGYLTLVLYKDLVQKYLEMHSEEAGCQVRIVLEATFE